MYYNLDNENIVEENVLNLRDHMAQLITKASIILLEHSEPYKLCPSESKTEHTEEHDSKPQPFSAFRVNISFFGNFQLLIETQKGDQTTFMEWLQDTLDYIIIYYLVIDNYFSFVTPITVKEIEFK